MKDWQDAIAGAVVCSRPCMICDFECVSNPAKLQSGPYSTPPHMIRSRLCSTTSGPGLTRRKAALHEKAYQKRIQCRLSRRSLQAHVRPCWCKLTNVQSLLLHLQATVAARLGHLVEPNGVVHAVGPTLAIVHLASASGHLDVLLAVNADARKRGVHRSGGQR